MSRLTREKDEFECRLPQGGHVCEHWVADSAGVSIYTLDTGKMCDLCPFMKYINKLAEYEDKNNILEDDLK